MNTPNTNITITRRIVLFALAAVIALVPAIALAHGGLEHVRGTITKVSDGSITVTTAAGKTVEVLLDAQTTFARASKPIQKADLKVGERVVIHAAEKDEILTAHTIEVGTATAAKKQ